MPKRPRGLPPPAEIRPPDLARTQLRWDRLLTGGVWAWMFLACCFPLSDTDFWWHLRTGELIVERGAVPQIDWYSYTDWDRPWIDLHWGFQLLVTGLYHLGGVNLVILAKAALLTLAVALGWCAAGRALPVWQTALLWLLPMTAITGRAYERPEMLSLLFLACWLWIVPRLAERPRLVWWLPCVQLVWTNCHALFVLGLVVGICALVDQAVRTWAGGRCWLEPASGLNHRWLLWAAGLVCLACFANPYFEEGALLPEVLYRKFSVEQEFYSRRIGELQRPWDFIRSAPGNWMQMYLLAEIGVWMATAASFLCLARFKRVSLYRLLLFAGFSHLAWEATRNTGIFSLVSGVVACGNFGDALRLAGSADRQHAPERPTSNLPGMPVSSAGMPGAAALRLVCTRGMTVATAGLMLCVVSGEWARWGEWSKAFGLGEARAWFAHDACRFAGQPGFPLRAFVAHHGQAAVYIYHNAPARQVFMDARLEVMTQQTFERYDEILRAMAHADRQWELLAAAGGPMPAVILDSRYSRPQIEGLLNTPGWRMVFADPAAAVFLEESLAVQLKLPPADPRPLMYPPGMR